MNFTPRLKHLLQVSTPAGHRCPKGEKKYPERKPQGRSGDFNSRWLPSRYGGRSVDFSIVDKPHRSVGFGRVHTKEMLPMGNLKTEDYRFWVGARIIVSRFSRCRACGTFCYGPEEMKAHAEHFHHTVWLTEAYKLLLRAGKCVMCEKKCTGQKWGVPLCCPKCIEDWMFGSPSGIEMAEALRVVKERVAADMESVRRVYEREWK